MAKALVGIIGGSGVDQIEGLVNQEWREVSSPFGCPSDKLLFGQIADKPIVFLPRHGRGHRLSPSSINYRANIDVLKRSGVTDVVSLSAVGSLKEKYQPGHFVLIDQFIDRTFAREKTFFEAGCVAHVNFAQPISSRLKDALYNSCKKLNIPAHKNGTYICMEGPQFSTVAESHLYRSWGCDVIGMTNMPEAKLAREAELPYATVAMVTDFDCWHPEHESVTVENVIKVMGKNTENACKLLRDVLPNIGNRPEVDIQGGDRALDVAVVTQPSLRDPLVLGKLDAVAGRVLTN
jgi:5'-methylthioadenosine phosphorylase